MKLTFNGQYQSLTSFPDTELNDFSIITGLNGSGKTHLLRAINAGHIRIDGVDFSEVIFYNYNDFTIHNIDPSQDPKIQQRVNEFENKSTVFSQKLNTERNNALSSFQLIYQFDGFQLGEYSFQHLQDFNSYLNWTEEDYDLFIQLRSNAEYSNIFEFRHLLRPHQQQLFDHLGAVNKTLDIREFVSSLKDFKLKTEALQIIKIFGYNEQFLDWKEQDLLDIFENMDKFGNHQNYFDSLMMEQSTSINHNALSYLQQLLSITTFTENFTAERALEFKEIIKSLFGEIEKHFINAVDPNYLNIIKNINKGSIFSHISSESGFLNLFTIKQAEKQYQINKKQQDYHYFDLFRTSGISIPTEEDYIKTYGESPVNILNKVLSEYDCNGYEFQTSKLYDDFTNGLHHQQIEISLYNKKGNFITTLDSLSSGERTLLALAFTIFKLKQKRVIAKVFLLDEIDSALHPSMSKRLLNVLHDLFHKEMGLNVIISTHSPSTVAFAPTNSTYIMRRDREPRLISASKDAALAELTTGVPSFSVNYENRRQVFVESKYDAEYYEELYRIFRKDLDQEISLNFISSGDAEINKNGIGMANCDQVVKITGLLRSGGNRFVWGIIDWDLKSPKISEGVKVLGLNQRYSIENYLLDPLLIGILMWRETYLDAKMFGFDEEVKYYEATRFTSSELQKIIDLVTEKLSALIKPNDSRTVTYQTKAGIHLTLPTWFTEHQGHKLEEQYLNAFPKLNEIKKGKEWLLKETVISKVISDFSNLAPIDLLSILKEVQEV